MTNAKTAYNLAEVVFTTIRHRNMHKACNTHMLTAQRERQIPLNPKAAAPTLSFSDTALCLPQPGPNHYLPLQG